METKPLTEQRDTLNILYYGPGGTGKTTDLAFMANLGRVLYVDAESGIKRGPLERLGVKTANIEILDVTVGFAPFEQAFWDIKSDLAADPDSWAGTVWDSVTEIHKAFLDDVVIAGVAKAQRQGKERDRFFIERGDWGVMTDQMRLLIRRYRDLPCHFGMAALERREQDDDGKVVYQPGVTPALQNDLIGYMDVVCHTSTELVGAAEEFHGLFRPVGKYQGKDRFGALPRRLVAPTFDRVLSYIDGSLSRDTDPELQAARARREQLAAQSKSETSEGDGNAEAE